MSGTNFCHWSGFRYCDTTSRHALEGSVWQLLNAANRVHVFWVGQVTRQRSKKYTTDTASSMRHVNLGNKLEAHWLDRDTNLMCNGNSFMAAHNSCVHYETEFRCPWNQSQCSRHRDCSCHKPSRSTSSETGKNTSDNIFHSYTKLTACLQSENHRKVSFQ